MSLSVNIVTAFLFLNLSALIYGTLEIKLVFLLSWSYDDKNEDPRRYAGAITRVLDDIRNATNLLPNVNITFVQADSGCGGKIPIKGTIDLAQENVSAFIGPYCTEECLKGGMISTHYKIPMITFGCSSIKLTDEEVYPYIARVKPYARMSKDYAPKALIEVMKNFNWTSKVCIIQQNDDVYKPLGTAMTDLMLENGWTTDNYDFHRYHEEHDTYEWKKDLLLEKKQTCRVFLLLTSDNEVREFMIQAWNNNLIKDYAYVTVDYSHNSTAAKNYKILNDDGVLVNGTNDFLKNKVLTGLIYPHPIRPLSANETYNNFRRDILRRVQLPPFNRNASDLTYKNIVTAASYLYDGTTLYSRAIDTMIKRGEDFRNTTALMNTIKNFKFQGISGEVIMDEHADRIPLFNIYNWKFGKRKIIGTYDASGNGSLKIKANVTAYFPGNVTQVPLDVPICGFDGEKCLEEVTSSKGFDYTALAISLPILFCFLFALNLYHYRKRKYLFRLLYKDLVIDLQDVLFGPQNLNRLNSVMSNASNFARKVSEAVSARGSVTTRAALYQLKKVFYKTIYKCNIVLTKEVLLTLKQVRALNHQNINPFVGIIPHSNTMHILWAYCDKGSLKDVLKNEDIQLDWSFKLSFASDIAKGLNELHRCSLKCHGNLTSSSCVIDNRWSVKLTDFAAPFFVTEDLDSRFKKMIRLAPEKLRDMKMEPSQETDVYQYGIILYEICTRLIPFSLEMERYLYDESEIIQQLTSYSQTELRPEIPTTTEASIEYIELMTKCWSEKPWERPHIKEIMKHMNNMSMSKGVSLVDHMLIMMEKYTKNLEKLVKERTALLEVEKMKSESLLYKMLPRSVANKLKEGQPVLAESFQSVTIYFSDIVGFTSLCSESTPLQVVDMLNDLYSCFDKCVDAYDAYKVETIGDAYMVVSGLPIRNENKHAGVIATMSMEILHHIKTFRIKHKAEKQLQLRIGIHSGPCVAGVVGTKMPRYCLFGDTVNTASRMESTGLPLTIHVSPECKTILDELGRFELIERGAMHVKGKGVITTYFLLGLLQGKDINQLRFEIDLRRHIKRSVSVLSED